jgi:hypothetical protein
MWEFIAWNMYTFERYSIKLQKSFYDKYFNDFDVLTIEVIANFFDIDTSN